MSFKILDHTADVAIFVEGKTIEELFISSCNGWKEITISSLKEKKVLTKKILLSAYSFDELLIELLSELNFLLTVKKFVFVDIINICFSKNEDKIDLAAEILFDEFDKLNHEIKLEIKAITFHKLKIEMHENIYSTIIVFDI